MRFWVEHLFFVLHTDPKIPSVLEHGVRRMALFDGLPVRHRPLKGDRLFGLGGHVA